MTVAKVTVLRDQDSILGISRQRQLHVRALVAVL